MYLKIIFSIISIKDIGRSKNYQFRKQLNIKYLLD